MATEVLTAGALAMRLEPLDADAELAVRPFVAQARRVLDRLGVEVLVRTFEPAGLPALYLLDQDTALQIDL